MSCVELFLFILKEHFKESNHIRRLDQSSRTGNSHINPLSPKSDQHEISPCNISAL